MYENKRLRIKARSLVYSKSHKHKQIFASESSKSWLFGLGNFLIGTKKGQPINLCTALVAPIMSKNFR